MLPHTIGADAVGDLPVPLPPIRWLVPDYALTPSTANYHFLFLTNF